MRRDEAEKKKGEKLFFRVWRNGVRRSIWWKIKQSGCAIVIKSQSLQEKNPTFQNLGLIFRPKNQNFPFPTCPRHTTSPIFGPPCPNFLDPLPHSLKIAPAVLLASCAWDADGEIDEEDEEEHNNTKKRQRLLLAATLRRRAAASSSPHFFTLVRLLPTSSSASTRTLQDSLGTQKFLQEIPSRFCRQQSLVSGIPRNSYRNSYYL